MELGKFPKVTQLVSNDVGLPTQACLNRSLSTEPLRSNTLCQEIFLALMTQIIKEDRQALPSRNSQSKGRGRRAQTLQANTQDNLRDAYVPGALKARGRGAEPAQWKEGRQVSLHKIAAQEADSGKMETNLTGREEKKKVEKGMEVWKFKPSLGNIKTFRMAENL